MSKPIVKTGTKPLRARNSFLRQDRLLKRTEAQARQAAAAKLNPAQRLAKLDAGNRYSGWKPLVARAERARLGKLLVASLEPGHARKAAMDAADGAPKAASKAQERRQKALKTKTTSKATPKPKEAS